MKKLNYSTLISVSGGVDSIYYAYRFITENPEELVLLHHCEYSKKRGKFEYESFVSLINYLKSNGYTNFDITITQNSLRGIPGKVMDIIPIYCKIGIIVKNIESIDRVIMPRCLEEVVSNTSLKTHLGKGKTLNSFVGDNRVAQAMALVRIISSRDIYFFSPYQHMTKKSMLESLPQELKDVVWSCRKPINNKPCGKCYACKRLK